MVSPSSIITAARLFVIEGQRSGGKARGVRSGPQASSTTGNSLPERGHSRAPDLRTQSASLLTSLARSNEATLAPPRSNAAIRYLHHQIAGLDRRETVRDHDDRHPLG